MFIFCYYNTIFFLMFYKYRKYIINYIEIFVELKNINNLSNIIIFQSIFIITLLTGKNANILKIKKYKKKGEQNYLYNINIGIVLNKIQSINFLFWFFFLILNKLEKNVYNIEKNYNKNFILFKINDLRNSFFFYKKPELFGWKESIIVKINLNNKIKNFNFFFSLFKFNEKK